MTLFFGGPFNANSFMDEADIVPPPDPVPIPDPPYFLATDEDELMLIGTIGYSLIATVAETKTCAVPSTTDVSLNNTRKARFTVVQIDVELSAAGVVTVSWDTSAASENVKILTGRRQLLAVPAAATQLSIVFPGAGTCTATFGRTEFQK